jgi:hypothetical protein
LETLFDVRTPDTFGIGGGQILFILLKIKEIKVRGYQKYTDLKILTSLTSLISPTSRCFESIPPPPPAPFVSASPSGAGPVFTGGHLDEMVPADNALSAKRNKRKKKLQLLLITLYTSTVYTSDLWLGAVGVNKSRKQSFIVGAINSKYNYVCNKTKNNA